MFIVYFVVYLVLGFLLLYSSSGLSTDVFHIKTNIYIHIYIYIYTAEVVDGAPSFIHAWDWHCQLASSSGVGVSFATVSVGRDVAVGYEKWEIVYAVHVL